MNTNKGDQEQRIKEAEERGYKKRDVEYRCPCGTWVKVPGHLCSLYQPPFFKKLSIEEKVK